MLIYQVHRRNFDSALNNPAALPAGGNAAANFELWIYLRVHLRQLNPPAGRTEFRVRDSDRHPIRCVRWTDADWAGFTAKYVRQVNEFWDSDFVLVTPNSYTGFDWPAAGPDRRRRNVDCRFQVSLNLHRHNAHAVIPCARVARNVASFRSNSLLYSDLDVNPDTYSSPTGRLNWDFFTTRHEVGHLLGLGHSNENSRQCRNHRNSSICYGATLEQQTNVMGEGTMLDLGNASPWRKRIALHTGIHADQWRAEWLSADAAFRGAESIHLH